jgi:hypothetical protein
MHVCNHPTHIHARIKPVKRTYEPGMKVSYDPVSKRVVVAFRGRITVLAQDYETEAEGTKAGELHCRTHGWSPNDQVNASPKRMRTLF